MGEQDETGKNEGAGDADQQLAGNLDGTADGQQAISPDAAGQSQEEKLSAAVTMANAEKAKRQTAESDAQTLRDQIALANATSAQNQQVQQQMQGVQKPLSTYELAIQQLGYDSEFLTELERTQVFRRVEELNNVRSQQQQTNSANIQFAQSKPDFGDVVGRYNATGMFIYSPELQEIINKKPYLQASCGTALGAYEIVMAEREAAESAKTVAEHAAAEAEANKNQDIENKIDPMSPAAVGGGGTVPRGGVITAQSTAADVAATQARIAAGEFD